MIKLEGVLFVVKKNRGRWRNEGGREEGRSSGNRLNIIDKFTNGFKFVCNSICKTDTSSYFLIFFSFFLFAL